MIAVDTNLLVYAHRSDMAQHRGAISAIESLMSHGETWAIPVPCATEFVAVVTGRAFGAARSPTSAAFDALDVWLSHPRCRLLAETDGHLGVFRALVERGALVGPDVFDARIAAICLEHGVVEMWTSDRDFSRFPDLRTRDPLIPSLHEPIGTAYRAALVPSSAPPASRRTRPASRPSANR